MVAITTRMSAGYPGVITRSDSLTVEQEVIDAAAPPTVYGAPVKIVGGKLRGVASGDAGTVVTGFLVKPYPGQSSSTAIGGPVTPPISGMADRLRRGFIAVTLADGTAAKDAQVYVVTTAGAPLIVGDIVTSTTPTGGGTGVAITNAFFTGPAFTGPDGSGSVVEIAYKI